MPTQSADWIAAARLVRRTGFGATGPAVDAALRTGATGYLAAALTADPASDPGALATPPPAFPAIAPVGKSASHTERQQRNRQVAAQVEELTGWWLRRMVAVRTPAVEKLTFGWHDHFATAVSKVRQPAWMLAQNQTLRRLGRGDFRPLALAMLTDAAMLFWLDGQTNTAAAPNENLAREFMELFTLGQGDGYTETDVRAGARALTGWRIRRDGQTYLDASRHDNGVKTFLGVTGNLDVTGYCDAVLARPSCPGHVAGRWWGQLVSDTPPSGAVLAALVNAYGPGRDLTALFRTMLTTPAFAAAEGTKVISPVEWLVGVVRALGLPASTPTTKLISTLRALGQVPFDPPNVSGWPSAQAWLSTASADLRLRAATTLARAGDLSTVTDSARGDRIDATGYLLGVGAWSDRSAAALEPSIDDPQRLVAVAVNTPEYLVH